MKTPRHALAGVFVKLFETVCVLVLLLLSACETLDVAHPPESSILPEPQILTDQSWSPYDATWTVSREEYEAAKRPGRTIYVAPVELEAVLKRIEGTRFAPRIKTQLRQEAQEVAHYMQNRFRLALENHQGGVFRPVEAPAPDSIIVQLALTDLRPTNAPVNALATVSSFIVPGSGLVRVVAGGRVGFECVVRDRTTDRVLMMFRDRKSDKKSAFTLRDFQQYGHIRVAIDEWAEQFAEVTSKAIGDKTERSLPFTLSPI